MLDCSRLSFRYLTTRLNYSLSRTVKRSRGTRELCREFPANRVLDYGVGRGAGVGRARGVGVGLPGVPDGVDVAVGVAVTVAVGVVVTVAVAVAVGVGVGVPPARQNTSVESVGTPVLS